MDNNGDSISDEELDKRYREIVDSFIDQANELTGHNSPENVGMAMLFAASRFNAFVVSQHAKDLGSYQADLPRAREFFSSRYAEMLQENLDDYMKIYQKYASFVKN